MAENQTSNHESEKAALKELYAGLNRDDISSILKFFDPQIERVEFEGSAFEGRCHGIDEVEAHFRKGRASWAEGACEPQRFVAVDNKVVVYVDVRVRLKDKSDWNVGRVGDVFTFRNGKIIEFRSFLDIPTALDWAGAKDPNH